MISRHHRILFLFSSILLLLIAQTVSAQNANLGFAYGRGVFADALKESTEDHQWGPSITISSFFRTDKCVQFGICGNYTDWHYSWKSASGTSYYKAQTSITELVPTLRLMTPDVPKKLRGILQFGLGVVYTYSEFDFTFGEYDPVTHEFIRNSLGYSDSDDATKVVFTAAAGFSANLSKRMSLEVLPTYHVFDADEDSDENQVDYWTFQAGLRWQF